ncbi:terminase-like family protein [Leptolyngbya sp. PCC 7375]|nr:terminase-like family protein [Leptolyngbya sp. PCC 7375]
MAKAYPLAVRAQAELELRRRRRVRGYNRLPKELQPFPNESPHEFLKRKLSGVLVPTGTRHLAVWDWATKIESDNPVQSRVEIWARGGAKSTIAEQLCVYLACALTRRFVLYVCRTQDQADMHVQAIAALLEQMGVPRAVNKYQASIAWTAERLQTLNGFGVLGVGLNSRVRGARMEQFRPDLIILDDVDGEHDSVKITQKKLDTISKAILAAGATYATGLFIQNKIHKDSAIAQVADGRAGILMGASVTEEPAVRGLEYEQYFDEAAGKNRYRVTGGEPTWPEGQDLTTAEKQINDWGLSAFLQESQHEDKPDGGLWKMERDIDPYRVTSHPVLVRIVIGVDPSGSVGTEAGIVAVGKTADKHYYVLADDSLGGTPNQWFKAAIARYHALKANTLAVERNYGGDMVKTAIQNMDSLVAVRDVQATRGKLVRSEPVQQLYENGQVHHVGHFPDLESEMCRWTPEQDSPNRMDALVWAVTELMGPRPPEFHLDTLVTVSPH